MPSVTVTEPGEVLAYCLIIGPDGKSSTVRALRANDHIARKTSTRTLARSFFRSSPCNGKEITREMVIYSPITLALQTAQEESAWSIQTWPYLTRALYRTVD